MNMSLISTRETNFSPRRGMDRTEKEDHMGLHMTMLMGTDTDTSLVF